MRRPQSRPGCQPARSLRPCLAWCSRTRHPPTSPGGSPMGDLHVMRDDLRPPEPPPRRHLISIGDLTRDDVERLLATARSFARSLEREMKKLPTLRGRTVVNLFYESSTRTSSSFELAAKRLSADVMSVKSSGS